MLQNKPGKKLCQGLAFFLTAALTATASPAGLLAHGSLPKPRRFMMNPIMAPWIITVLFWKAAS